MLMCISPVSPLYLPYISPQEQSLVLMCGPPPMIKNACLPNLAKLGYSKAQQIVF